MSKRILLVENEPGFVLTLTNRLISEGYNVESERDGGAGFERASNEAKELYFSSGSMVVAKQRAHSRFRKELYFSCTVVVDEK
jgi:CheY-like chemotaxis protein